MWVSKAVMVARNAKVDARIKELENIICPAEQHDYALCSENTNMLSFDVNICVKRYVCKRCLKEKITEDFV